MADTIRLAVTASPSALPVIRMVLGGVAARVDLSLEELEDLYVAVEELLSAAEVQGEASRHELTVEVGVDGLVVNAGPFKTAGLRDSLAETERDGFNLRTVMDNVVQSVEVCQAPDDCFTVVFVKRRGSP